MPKISEQESVPVTLSFRVTDETDETIRAIMKDTRRKQAEVCRGLIERGVAAYKRDNELFEPDEEQTRKLAFVAANQNERPEGRKVRPDTRARATGSGRKR